MATISPIQIPTLVFRGEGETKFATPQSAPMVVAAHEAENLRTFEHRALVTGGRVEDKQIILKYSYDPNLKRLVVSGGESRAKIYYDQESPQSVSSPKTQDTSSPSQPQGPHVFDVSPPALDVPDTQQPSRRETSEKLESLENRLEQKLRKLEQEVRLPENQGDTDPESIRRKELTKDDVERKLDYIRRLKRRVEAEDHGDKQADVLSSILRSLAQAAQLTRAVRDRFDQGDARDSRGNQGGQAAPLSRALDFQVPSFIGLLVDMAA
ncbi:MAG: hypothetical protein HYU64_01775 [Armatimonadetes bacterium]|nr:hypothetical protein [Armatimonadota bacterium]